jgi:hypothetical protein
MRATVICLTPVKNEGDQIDRFLKCASLWADHIIVCYQNSTDASTEIALNYEKVNLIENPSVKFNELERQKILLAKAREIPGKKLLIAPRSLCTDNAVMVASLAYHKYKAGIFADLTLEAKATS